ncbi:MAG: ABC transporter permease [Spirochaetaceae bacterium]|nr:ABC transporter permease [Spirochaetaceae bacterium]
MDAFVSNFGLLINATLVATPPLLLAALGSCFSERSGVINLGIGGMMTIGAFVGAAIGLVVNNGWIAFLAGGLAGAVMAAIHALICIQYHADQTIAGTAMNFIGPGLALFLCKAIFGSTDTPPLKLTDKLPKMFEGTFEAGSFLSNVLNVYTVAYLVFLFAAIAVFVFYKTKFGTHLRAVGEHPEACESLGINVYKVRYICVIVSGFLSGLGGAFVTTATINQFRPNVIVGQGFIAIAAVIFGKFSPGGATKACLLFGLCSGVKTILSMNNAVDPNLISMIPYVVTIATLVLFVGNAHTPAANGKPFVKSK